MADWKVLGRIHCPNCRAKFKVEGDKETSRLSITHASDYRKILTKSASALIKDWVDLGRMRCPNPNCRVTLDIQGDLKTGYLSLGYTKVSGTRRSK